MPANKKVADDVVIESYGRLGNVHLVAKEVGLNHASVHERLVKLGLNKKMNVFTDADREVLKAEYAARRLAGTLGELAKKMGRTLPFLSRQAAELGLVNTRGAKPYMAKWKYMTEEQAEALLNRLQTTRMGMGQFCKKHGMSLEGLSNTMRKFFPDTWEALVEAKQPKQSMYRIGRAFEYRTRDDLRKRGYWVLRSPASRSALDLIAIKPGTVLMVQCKRSGALPPGEWNAIYDLAMSVGAVPLMTEMHHSGRGISYWLMTGRKDGSKKRQPMEPWNESHEAPGPGVRVRVGAA